MSSNRWTLRVGLACVAGTLCVVPLAAEAETAPAFPILLKQAQTSAPRLMLGEAETRAAQGLAAQAAARPNPTLGLMVENAAGSGPYKDFDSVETTLSIEQSLELGGKRTARTSVAQADVAAAQARGERSRIDFARDLALAYAGAEAGQWRLAIARDAIDLAEADARAVRLLVDNGKEAEVRALQAQATLASVRAELGAVKVEAEASLTHLGALTGAPDGYAGVAGGLLNLAVATSPSPSQAFSPAIAAARAERDAAERRIALEKSRRTPDVAVSFGLRRLRGDDATAAVFGLSAPLPLFDRNRGAVAAATANAQAAQARLAIAEADQAAERRAATGQVEASSQTLEASLQAETAAAEAYRLARIGYDAGRLPLSEVLSARRDLISARSRAVDTKLARVKAFVDLARAQGRMPFGDQP